ncbi:lipocalin family protein [Streptomyces sp. NPDC002431]
MSVPRAPTRPRRTGCGARIRRSTPYGRACHRHLRGASSPCDDVRPPRSASLPSCSPRPSPLSRSCPRPPRARTARPAPPVPFDLGRYTGTWFQLAAVPQLFELQCAKNVKAVHGATGRGGVAVTNSCATWLGASSRITGEALPLDARTATGTAPGRTTSSPAWDPRTSGPW